MNYTVIVHKNVGHTKETTYKLSGPIWDETTFLQV